MAHEPGHSSKPSRQTFPAISESLGLRFIRGFLRLCRHPSLVYYEYNKKSCLDDRSLAFLHCHDSGTGCIKDGSEEACKTSVISGLYCSIRSILFAAFPVLYTTVSTCTIITKLHTRPHFPPNYTHAPHFPPNTHVHHFPPNYTHPPHQTIHTSPTSHQTTHRSLTSYQTTHISLNSHQTTHTYLSLPTKPHMPTFHQTTHMSPTPHQHTCSPL